MGKKLEVVRTNIRYSLPLKIVDLVKERVTETPKKRKKFLCCTSNSKVYHCLSVSIDILKYPSIF